ncbi:hypothetical protein ACFW46_35870, partial [Streptomyces rochei]
MRVFLARQMLEESAEFFLRLDVVADGQILKSFTDLDKAAEFAAAHEVAGTCSGLLALTKAADHETFGLSARRSGHGKPSVAAVD